MTRWSSATTIPLWWQQQQQHPWGRMVKHSMPLCSKASGADAKTDFSRVPTDPDAFTIEVLAANDPDELAHLVRAMFLSAPHKGLVESSLDPAAVVIVRACSMGMTSVAVAMYERMVVGYVLETILCIKSGDVKDVQTPFFFFLF